MGSLLKKHTLAFLLAYLLLLHRLHAFDGPATSYLGIEQGLSNNSVVCVYQDHNGFMWFGTYDGLNRFDGYEFTVFKHQVGDTASLPGNTIYSIEGDSSHRLWIGARQGLAVYHPLRGSFSPVRFSDWRKLNSLRVSGSIQQVKTDAQGDVWVGTEHQGLLRFPAGSLNGMQVPLLHRSARTGAYAARFMETHPQKGLLWVFVENEGLGLYDSRHNAVQIVSAAQKKINVLRTDRQGQLWVGTDNGLYRFDAATRRFSANYLAEPARIINITADPNGMLWLASDGNGLLALPPGAPQAQPYLVAGTRNRLTSNSLTTVYLDRQGRKWIGTLRGGINIIEPRPNPFKSVFSIFDQAEEPARNFINSFCEAPGGNVWIGTSGAGLKYWDRHRDTYTYYTHRPRDEQSISSNIITYMARDFEGATWLATWNGGLNRLRKPGGPFERFACENPFTGAEEKNVWVVYEDRHCTLWASTTNNGTLYRLNRDSNRFELFDRRLENLQCLAEDRRGTLWGGNYSSLIQIDRQGRRHRFFTIGYPVRSILEDRQGNFWVGTDGAGLLQFDRQTGRYTRYTTANGLPGNTILRILESNKGRLWISTFTGLSRFDPQKKEFRTFSLAEGVPNNQYNFNAAGKLSTGEFLFGGIRGYTYFNPDSVVDFETMPEAQLTGLKINNEPIEQDDSYISKKTGDRIVEVTVPYNRAMITLSFVALEYRAPGNIRYAYWLEGWDKGWTDAGKIRTAHYSRLREGTYLFKLKHTNAAGVWSAEKTLLRVVVLPPWHRSWWAFLLYLLAAGLAVNQYFRYTKKLEVLVAERTRELQRSNEDLQQFAHVASHDLKEPVRKMKTFTNFLTEALEGRLNDREKNYLHKVHSAVDRMFIMIEGVLAYSTINAQEQTYEPVNLNEVLKHIESDLEVLIHQKAAVIQHAPLPVVEGAPVLLYQLFYNLINNSLKFTKPGRPPVIALSSEIFSKQGKEWARIIVKDNGIGFDQKYAERIFGTFTRLNAKDKFEGTGLGLALCKKIVERHGGSIAAHSQENEGAAFEILLPLKRLEKKL
ncbi:two-component regulator propeller domain-containing protein [Paraflavisolibacter sp. H34]|uniref:ligand-binding sensor domain-containing protein n=1 Tax=Huijunlia imazamoxiresistens TaxID=3127457 RepID=UPI0030159B46